MRQRAVQNSVIWSANTFESKVLASQIFIRTLDYSQPERVGEREPQQILGETPSPRHSNTDEKKQAHLPIFLISAKMEAASCHLPFTPLPWTLLLVLLLLLLLLLLSLLVLSLLLLC